MPWRKTFITDNTALVPSADGTCHEERGPCPWVCFRWSQWPSAAYPPQCPGRDAERRRAGTIRVALNYAALLLAWLLCFLARGHGRTAIPSRTWAFLGLWEMKWTSFIIFIPSSENGQGDGEGQEHGISGCWEGGEIICIHFFSPHSPGVCFQCGSSNDLVHQR